MRDKQTPEWAETAELAEKGIRALQRDLLLLSAPDAVELNRRTAPCGSCTPLPTTGRARRRGVERLGATRMRQYVRAWINACDLVRPDPAHVPDLEVLDVTSRDDEDHALEQG